jgi:hypothetical protein
MGARALIHSFLLDDGDEYIIHPESRELTKVPPGEETFRTVIVEEIIQMVTGLEPKIKVTIIDEGFEDHPYLAQFYPFAKVVSFKEE